MRTADTTLEIFKKETRLVFRRFVPFAFGLFALSTALHAAQPKFTLGEWSAMQDFTDSSGTTIHYYLFTPKTDAAAKVPLVVWLHGGVKSNGTGAPNLPADAFYKDAHQKEHPCYVLRPVAIQGQNWITPGGAGTSTHTMPEKPSRSLAAVAELIDKIVKEKPIDEARQYVLGASMGGYGTWDIVERFPKKFAAALPMCGAGDPGKAESLKAMPLWIFHGDSDKIVSVKGSRDMFQALIKARNEQPPAKDEAQHSIQKSADGKLRYTEYTGGGHNSGWDNALAEPELLEWVFAQSLPKEK